MPRKSYHIRALEQVLLTNHMCRLFALDNIHQLAEGDIDDAIFDDHNDLFVLVACLHGHIQEIRHNCWRMTEKMGRRSNRHAVTKCVEDVAVQCNALQCSVATFLLDTIGA